MLHFLQSCLRLNVAYVASQPVVCLLNGGTRSPHTTEAWKPLTPSSQLLSSPTMESLSSQMMFSESPRHAPTSLDNCSPTFVLVVETHTQAESNAHHLARVTDNTHHKSKSIDRDINYIYQFSIRFLVFCCSYLKRSTHDH